ncbi:PhzF family phenazine biosynthesis protein [Streptomyces murinus]|uniref:PhzF family phenazine biosynthesis protein n=1 Tax=Streptomyces murinus TaxID=33900 RepID=UPI00381021E0
MTSWMRRRRLKLWSRLHRDFDGTNPTAKWTARTIWALLAGATSLLLGCAATWVSRVVGASTALTAWLAVWLLVTVATVALIAVGAGLGRTRRPDTPQGLPYRLADVFTEVALAGNQLAVFTSGGGKLSTETRQAIAREMNLSETVFIVPPEAGGDAKIRMYSSVCEIDFAGHPLLGTACVLTAQWDLPVDAITLRIETNVGQLPVKVIPQGPGRYRVWMEQPLPEIRNFDRGAELLEALGLERSLLPIQVSDAGIPHLYVTAESVEAVEGIVPDFPLLGRIAGGPRINVFAGQGREFTTRMFSPFDYVPEDPACGSAAGPLAAHLVRYGLVEPGTQITLSQGASIGRPSTLYAVAHGSADQITSIEVGGGVCLIGGGELVPPVDVPADDDGSAT